MRDAVLTLSPSLFAACRQCAEGSTIAQHLHEVLGPDSPPAMWDGQRRYAPQSVDCYIVTYQTPLVVKGKRVWIEDADTGRRCRMEWRKVDPSHTISQVLTIDGHVVPRMLVLHVVLKGTPFEAHMLKSDPERYTD